MKVALDTNILAYAEGVNGEDRRTSALRVLCRLSSAEVVIAVQTLGELHSVLTRKGGRSKQAAADALLPWRQGYTMWPTSTDIFDQATALAARHDLQIWDAIILEAAAEAGCALLLSEDMHDGFVYRGVTVANPFAAEPHPLLASLLEDLP